VQAVGNFAAAHFAIESRPARRLMRKDTMLLLPGLTRRGAVARA